VTREGVSLQPCGLRLHSTKARGGILEQEEDPYRCTSCDRAPSLPRLFSSTRLSYAEAIVGAPASSVEVFQYQSNCFVFT
jgi:hypothetical protein